MIVELCVHGEAKPHRHRVTDSRGVWHYKGCSGGRVLNQAIIIERDADGEWPLPVLPETFMDYDQYTDLWLGPGQMASRRIATAILDALASAQEQR